MRKRLLAWLGVPTPRERAAIAFAAGLLMWDARPDVMVEQSILVRYLKRTG